MENNLIPAVKFSFMPKTEGMLNFPSDVDHLSSIDLIYVE